MEIGGFFSLPDGSSWVKRPAFGVAVAGLEVVKAGRVPVVAGEAIEPGDRFGGLSEEADASGAVGVRVHLVAVDVGGPIGTDFR
ncbi:hypothetical protein [Streptomyces sp. NPDC088258]|uniref:hypothetical protein n=1 Tax=Streptomyces sp. NPDC088258 TaxID=3365849 RepID=UPI00382B98FE